MSVVRFNPWRDMDDLFGSHPRPSASAWVPAVDVWESADDFRIELDIPAVILEDVEISLTEGILEISGERKDSESDEKVKSHRLERRHGAFTRRFRLPEVADEEDVRAQIRDGVLQIVIAKRLNSQPRRIEIAAA